MQSDKERATILIVDDDPELAEMLEAYFKIQGYLVVTASGGQEALLLCEETRPDMVLLDVNMPEMDGFEVAQRLREKRSTRDLPVIFLTAREAREDRLTGLGLSPDDYMTKPFDVQELRLRVRNSLARAAQTQLRNPVTNLPEGQWVDERLRETLLEPGWAMLVISIENLSYFREEYGFITADDVMRALSLMIENTVHSAGSASAFLGHLSPQKFLVITTPESGEQMRRRLAGPLHQSLEFFYPMRDRESDTGRLKLAHANRLGVRFGLLRHTDVPIPDIKSLKQHLSVLTSR
jgi:DNA-binding response OmpR family regulator